MLKNGPQYTRGELLEFVYDLDMTPEEVMKKYEEQFSAQDFLGDGFPFFYVRTTGLLGVFMGQDYEVSVNNGTVWYKELDLDPEQLHFQVDTDHPMYRRMIELNLEFQRYFHGKAVLGGANLGGVCDVYHSMRGMENTIYDLSDYPDEVREGMWEIHSQWMNTQKKLLSLVDPEINHGYTHWTGILTKVPYDMIQADLAFLVGPDDYREFIHPLVCAEAKAFERSMIHLDGPGFIKHMPDILGIPELDGVQWIPGAGSDPVGEWEEFYQLVSESDKLLQVFIEKPEEIPMMEKIASRFKNPSRICFICSGTEADRPAYEQVMKKFGM